MRDKFLHSSPRKQASCLSTRVVFVFCFFFWKIMMRIHITRNINVIHGWWLVMMADYVKWLTNAKFHVTMPSGSPPLPHTTQHRSLKLSSDLLRNIKRNIIEPPSSFLRRRMWLLTREKFFILSSSSFFIMTSLAERWLSDTHTRKTFIIFFFGMRGGGWFECDGNI